MKVIRDHNGNVYEVELTRRNLQALLDKLDDPLSACALEKDGVIVHSVEDAEHYADCAPGPVYMPTTGETR